MYDLVCGMGLEDMAPIKFEFQGKEISVCSEDCKKEFFINPKRYENEQPLIELKDVWRTFELGTLKVDVLRGLSLRIFRGQFVALIGASGSGKSTAMYTIGSLDRPSRGSVRVEGLDTSKLTDTELAHFRGKKVGFVFQQFHLIPALSALENVMMPAIFQGMSRAEARSRAGDLLGKLGLKERVVHRPTELSGGEQQRVAIARALINEPELILADEPTGNLDSRTSETIIEYLVDLWKRFKVTLVIVTHDAHIAQHSERVMSLRDGRLFPNHRAAEHFLWREKKPH